MQLIVGLGNPGQKYARSRHNIGWMAVDRIAQDHGFGPWRPRFQGLIAEGRLGDVRVMLLGREGVFSALVEPDRTDALIGALVLEDLDFLVDCTQQALYPRDPDMIVSEVE